jgi:predicted negative regulator of RcsB-dependent stress response
MSEHNPWQEPVIEFYRQYKHFIIISIILLFAVLGGWEFQKQTVKNNNAQLSILQSQWVKQNSAKDSNHHSTLEQMKALNKTALITQLVMAAAAKNELMSNPQNAVKIYKELLTVCFQPFCDLYRLRLSIIYINMKAPNEAISALKSITEPSFLLFRDLYLGDSYKTLNDDAQAVLIWKQAYGRIHTQNMDPISKGIKDQLTYRLQKEFS